MSGSALIRKALRAVMIVLMVLVILGPRAITSAAPHEGRVTRGEATFQRDGNDTTIEAGRNAIIEYDRFNIAADESVRFVQPDAHSRVLNRVTAGDASRIAGELRANGIVYLTNPAGILFTPGAQINVGGLYAAAGHISDGEFLSGTDHFHSLDGEVANYGQITGERIHLLGRHVRNHGTIRAEAGVVTMLAGDDVLIRRNGGRVHVKIDGRDLNHRDRPVTGSTPPQLDAEPGVENTGAVEAPRGQITLGAGDTYALAVRNPGTVQAAGGEVDLGALDGAVHNEGRISASADPAAGAPDAGRVSVQGPAAVNHGQITADASAVDDSRAGEIEFTSDRHTYLLDGSSLSASGGDGNANGGSILVHSYHGHTTFADGAVVDVSGGTLGGAGGFTEISGQTISFLGSVDLAGVDGLGHLLIDPRDLRIVPETDADNDAMLDDSNTIAFDEPDSDTDITISSSAIEALTGDITLQAERDLFVEHPLELVNANNLTLEAKRHLTVDESITGAAMLALTADFDQSGEGTLAINAPIDQILNIATFNGADILINTNAITTGHLQLFQGPVTFERSATLDGSGAQFGGTVDAASGVSDVDLHITGSGTFSDDIGRQQALQTLTVDHATNLTHGSDTLTIQTTGNQSYGSAFNLHGDAVLAASDSGAMVHFDSNIDAGGQPPALTIDAGAAFAGPIGSIRPEPLRELHVTGATHHDGGRVETTGQQTYAGPVTLGSDTDLVGGQRIELASTIDGNHALLIDAGNSAGSIHLGDDVGVNTPLASLEMRAEGLIEVRGELIHAVGEVLANPQGRDGIPTVATIAAPDGGLTIRSDDAGFVMGQHEKLTALGDLTIDVAETATLGDMSSLGDMRVHAETIELRRREAGDVLEADGELRPDTGLSYIAAGTFDFSVEPTSVGEGPDAVFASPVEKADLTGNLPEVLENIELTESDFLHNGVVLTLRYNAPTPTDPGDDPDDPDHPDDPDDPGDSDEEPKEPVDDEAETEEDRQINLAATFAEEGDVPFTDEVPEEALLGPATWEAMHQLALRLRPIGTEALVQRLAGRHVIDDSAEPDAVTVYRVRADDARRVLERYFDLFVEQLTDPQTGERVLRDRTSWVRATIDDAWGAYVRSTDDDPTATGFREFLDQPEEAEARRYVGELAAVLAELRELGVSPAEYARIRDALLERFAPRRIPLNQLRDVLELTAT